MDTPRPPHLRGADDVAAWVAGSQIAWDLVARRYEPFNALRQADDNDHDDGDPFALLRELYDRMPAAEAPAADAPSAIADNDTTRAAYVEDAYRNGGFPASGDAIAGLPETSAGEARERVCAVCMQDFEGGDKLRSLPCAPIRSMSNASSTGSGLRVSRACPLCRHRLPMKRE